MWTDEELHRLGEVVEEKSQGTGICIVEDGVNSMIANIPTVVIPYWYIEKWLKENSEPGSALDHFVRQMVKDWKIEEIRIKNED